MNLKIFSTYFARNYSHVPIAKKYWVFTCTNCNSKIPNIMHIKK